MTRRQNIWIAKWKLTFVTKHDEDNSCDDVENTGGQQIREMLKNVFSIVQFDDGDHWRSDDDGEKHRKVWPEAHWAVKLGVDPWQEENVSKT